MKIAILNGSPRKANTSAMVQAFMEGAKAVGHEVEEYQVGKMKIAGCLGCEYCHTKGAGRPEGKGRAGAAEPVKARTAACRRTTWRKSSRPTRKPTLSSSHHPSTTSP